MIDDGIAGLNPDLRRSIRVLEPCPLGAATQQSTDARRLPPRRRRGAEMTCCRVNT